MSIIALIASLLALTIAVVSLRRLSFRERFEMRVRAEDVADEARALIDAGSASDPKRAGAMERDLRRLATNLGCLAAADLRERLLALQRLRMEARRLAPPPATLAMRVQPPPTHRLH